MKKKENKTTKKKSKNKKSRIIVKKSKNTKQKKEFKHITKKRKDVLKNLKHLPIAPSIHEEIKNHIKNSDNKNILEKYEIELDKVNVTVSITKDKTGFIYIIQTPQISVATNALLDDIREELISVTTVGMNEIIDQNAFKQIKEKFAQEAESLIKEKLPNIDETIKDFFIGKLMQDMLGLGKIEFLINDINLEEIVIPSAKEPIRVYHKKYGWLLTNLKTEKEEDIINYSNIIARRVGRQINVLTPLLDAHLSTGDRVNSILYPISTKGNTITIRKFARDPYTIIDLIKNKTISIDVAVLLWLAIEYEMNILISGGTASGKTVLLNSCMPFMPPNQRIISVEDTRELMLPEFLYWCPLVTRSPNAEGKGSVTMLDLLVNSLRMRPDKIILGEMRRQEEAMVLFEAMHTGHSVYATLHADSASETVSRLINPPLNVPANLLKAVDLNVVIFRDRKKGTRRVFQVAEFDYDGTNVTTNIIYRWIPEEDRLIKHSESSRFFENISRNTGLSQKEIDADLKEKSVILDSLLKNDIRSLNEMGRVINMYYNDRENLLKNLSKSDFKKTLMG